MQVETDAAAISAYIIFLSKYGLPTAEEIKVKERHELEELAMVNIIDINRNMIWLFTPLGNVMYR